MLIVSRSQWGARAPKAVNRISLPTPRLWVHHTATEQHGAAGVRAIQSFHMDSKDWNDIAYSFLVDDDGTIYEGRGAGVAGGHTEGDNSSSHAICLMGNFENRTPTAAATTAVAELAAHGRDQGWWVPTLGGHRDAPGASTACPGERCYVQLPTIRLRVASPTPVPTEDDFMALFNTKEEFYQGVREGVARELRTSGSSGSEAVKRLVAEEVDRVVSEIVAVESKKNAAFITAGRTSTTFDPSKTGNEWMNDAPSVADAV